MGGCTCNVNHVLQRHHPPYCPGCCEYRAIDKIDVTPVRVTTDNATCDPPSAPTVLPHAKHCTSTYLNNVAEGVHGHLKQRRSPMREFKHAAGADRIVRGHVLIQTLRNGFSRLTAAGPRQLGVLTMWSQLRHACSSGSDPEVRCKANRSSLDIPTQSQGNLSCTRSAADWVTPLVFDTLRLKET